MTNQPRGARPRSIVARLFGKDRTLGRGGWFWGRFMSGSPHGNGGWTVN